MHIFIGQQGWPAAPQATDMPPLQIMPVPVVVPSATQPVAVQHAGSAQCMLAQHAWPGWPHGGPQLLLAQAIPFMHAEPGATQRSPLLSQHAPPPHEPPAQQS